MDSKTLLFWQTDLQKRTVQMKTDFYKLISIKKYIM